MAICHSPKCSVIALAIYVPLYIVALQLSHWIRERSIGWEDVLISVLTAVVPFLQLNRDHVVLGLVFFLLFVVGSHVPTKDE